MGGSEALDSAIRGDRNKDLGDFDSKPTASARIVLMRDLALKHGDGSLNDRSVVVMSADCSHGMHERINHPKDILTKPLSLDIVVERAVSCF